MQENLYNSAYDLTFINLNLHSHIKKRKVDVYDYIIYRLKNPNLDRDDITKYFNCSHITITNLNKDLNISTQGNTFYFGYLKTYYPHIKYCKTCDNYFDTQEHFLGDGTCRLNNLKHQINRRNSVVRITNTKILNELFDNIVRQK